jgi:hypothetical protein
VQFIGIATEMPSGPTPVFRPTNIEAKFEFLGNGKAETVLDRTYHAIWKGVIDTFPSEAEWSEAKSSFADFIAAQADLLRARSESSRE